MLGGRLRRLLPAGHLRALLDGGVADLVELGEDRAFPRELPRVLGELGGVEAAHGAGRADRGQHLRLGAPAAAGGGVEDRAADLLDLARGEVVRAERVHHLDERALVAQTLAAGVAPRVALGVVDEQCRRLEAEHLVGDGPRDRVVGREDLALADRDLDEVVERGLDLGGHGLRKPADVDRRVGGAHRTDDPGQGHLAVVLAALVRLEPALERVAETDGTDHCGVTQTRTHGCVTFLLPRRDVGAVVALERTKETPHPIAPGEEEKILLPMAPSRRVSN